MRRGDGRFSESVHARIDATSTFETVTVSLARLLGIPLLDFDAYQLSGDAAPTARAVTPAVLSFFRANA